MATPSGHAGRLGRGRAALRALRAVKCPVASRTAPNCDQGAPWRRAADGRTSRDPEYDRAVPAGRRGDDSSSKVSGRENGRFEEGRGAVAAEHDAAEGDGLVPCQM